MKIISLTLCFCMATIALSAQSKKELQAELTRVKATMEALKASKVVDITDPADKTAYALGVMMASSARAQGIDSLKLEALMLAFQDVYADRTLKIEKTEASTIVQQYVQEAQETQKVQKKTEGEVFLKRNKDREGVQETASGLQYKVIQVGSGQTPKPADQVTVHYTGKLLNGTVFDSSVERGEPITLGVSQVIPGWTEALQLMKEGDKWELFIPYQLAYGERGAGGEIQPYATLIFEVELLKINE